MMMVVYVDYFFKYEPDIGFSVFEVGFVSYRSRMLSSTMILIIFFGKQAFSAVVNHRTAGVIHISPTIIWL